MHCAFCVIRRFITPWIDNRDICIVARKSRDGGGGGESAIITDFIKDATGRETLSWWFSFTRGGALYNAGGKIFPVFKSAVSRAYTYASFYEIAKAERHSDSGGGRWRCGSAVRGGELEISNLNEPIWIPPASPFIFVQNVRHGWYPTIGNR